MTMESSFVFPLAGGLHARPAAALRECALPFEARFELINDRTGLRADLLNLLSLLATDTRQGDPCRLRAEGPGAGEALERLDTFLRGPFLATDTPGEAAAAPARAGTVIPAILARAGRAFHEGVPIAPGVGTGPAALAAPAWPEPDLTPSSDPAAESRQLAAAFAKVLEALRGAAAAAGPGPRPAILGAQAAMLQDGTWREAMEAGIRSGRRAPAALREALDAARAVLQASPTIALRERALDLQDLGARLLAELTGASPAALHLPGPCVLVASELTPSALLALDRDLVRALVLAEGAATSHTAILARSFGIPCVICPEASRTVPGRILTVDGDRGLVVEDPPPALEAYYAIQALERSRRPDPGAGATTDGVALVLQANILSPREAGPAVELGAEGIGLFRSEMLFLERPEPPGEEEQFEAYRAALEAAQGRPVVLRLLDVGGDKPLPYLPLPREANPYLGRRGVRWYGLHPGLVRTQLQAAVRAARHGDLRLMIPMVAEVEEIRAVRDQLREITATPPPLGIMVEVPAAALNLPALAAEADFFCVGTNDLVQYLFAADRGDAQVARPCHDWHPATLRMLDRIVRDAEACGRPLSLCGELAGNPALLPLLVGLGLRTLSMTPSLLAGTRRALATLDSAACRALVMRALAAGTAAEVEALLAEGAASAAPQALTDPSLVLADASCTSKEEALKLLSERMASLGRARDPLALEEALWAREEAYATGIGFGFAVPHCKSPSVAVSSLAVLRLREPVEWGSLDGLPVDFLLLLATGGEDGGQEHLRIFARLARKLMDPSFREALRGAPGSQAILDLLQRDVLAPL
jgi:fructose-specific PTS system IIA-like component